MSRIAYVNGQYVRHADAAVHVEDRGYQFADGVYEVCEVWQGKIVDMPRHLDRLHRSLNELRIDWPMARSAVEFVIRQVIRRNRVVNGLVYIQVTRGVAKRDHFFPAEDVAPSIVVTAKPTSPAASQVQAEKGIAVVSYPENRWPRVDIKTIALLPNVLAKQHAKENGGKEAWYIDADGNVTEGGSTNAWIVTKEGALVTRPAENGILRGITRAVVLDLVQKEGLTFDERPFSLAEAFEAKEAFVTAASTLVMPVTRIDGKIIGNGHPGSVATRLRELFHTATDLQTA
ncbi:D-amino-acid transaminase [Roseibium album]|uniref:Probable branched-chain-amino-acid aminotransferase n=1 Tax=Roseibium album TaxID=311410 RepID=A0A0M7B0M9_9HYPH|nr:D-amino-acid transaminase [Roseibium album]CTQ62295.1 D-alanine aminotransferase [Roseibium album]CTQ77839.1 D-alanine aminotransferase [Roseibium album]CTQ80060.1 D-alanine aminotransferase [Roseibium album]